MAALKRHRGTWVLILLLAGGFFLLREKRSEAIPGTFVINTARTFASLDNSADDCDATVGVFHPCLDNLEIDGPSGVIRCNDGDPGSVGGNACNITIVVNANMDMHAGSKITADNTAGGGSGGDIDITVGGNLTLQGTTGGTVGALISARKLAGAGDTGTGGDITIKVGGVTVSGDVVTCVTPVGDVTVGKGAQITSGTFANPASNGPAGDIKIYAGHNIAIDGSVTAEGTTGAGQGGQITIKACCDLLVDDDGFVSSRGADPGADLVHLEACTVEILGLVQSTGPGHIVPPDNHCNVNRPGKPPNSTGCVEIWAGTTILIDNTGTNNGVINADVGQSGGTQGTGWIDVLANLDITIHGDPTTPYNAGGDINNNALVSPPWSVHANMNLQNGHGGDIAVQSKLGNVTTSGRAIQANSSIASNGGKGGHVKVEGAGNVAFGNASVQAMGDTTGGGGQAGGTIVGHAFNLGSTLTGAAPGQLDAAGPGGSIKLFGCAGVVYTGVSNPAFIIDPVPVCGDPVVLPSPAATSLPSQFCQAQCVTVTPTPTPTNTPPSTTVTPTPTATPTPGGSCVKSEVIGALAGHVPDNIVRLDLNNETIQHAVSTATDSNNDGFIIVLVVKDGTGALGGSTHQSVIIDQVYPKPFQLFGCSVTMIDDTPHDASPTGWIKTTAASPANIFVMDLHGTGSDVAGWKVEGDGRTLRNVEGDTSGVGVWFVGNNNTMHNGKALHNNGVGLLVSGNGNVVTDTLVEFNTGNGIEVHGNNNQILKTQLGDIGKGNTGDGLNVSGTGNLLQENTSRSNTGDGIHVLTVNGNNTLTKNLCGGTASQNNGPCEYDVAAGNNNGGGNKAHGVLVTGSPFPAGCIP